MAEVGAAPGPVDHTSKPESVEPERVALFTHNLVLDPVVDPVVDLA